ncbi:MAG: RloB domain-containing protein [Saprospiraceae bacterium]
MARRKLSPRRKTAQICSIVVDGETESWYLEALSKAEGIKQLKIKPDLPKKKRLDDLYKYVAQQATDYDKVIWIIDMDTTIAESKVANTLKETMQKFQRKRKSLEAQGISVIINTPCLEK